MNKNFCALILSHDRAGNIPTLNTLKRHGYTGDWYIVIDDPADKEPYYDEYGEEKVIYFEKDDVADEIDRGDNFDRRNCIIYARYHSFQIAQELGYEYFIQLDDDYTGFEYKFNEDFEYGWTTLEGLDELFENAVDFLERSGIDTVALGQGGDYIGGSKGTFADAIKTKRKAMNTFICRSDNPIEFRGSVNEDVNTYTRAQQLGDVYLTINFAMVKQEQTQQNEGGMAELYKSDGTYVKSFYTLLYSPSSVSLSKMGSTHLRIHHKVNWRKTVPKIVPESTKN